MEEAIVSFAIERISDLLIHEAVFLGGVCEEVERIKTELKRMQCFLKDADRKQEQDERLRNRVAEIRDLAYDSEDVIDAFILKVAHQGGFHGIIKRFTSIFSKPFHLHKIGMEVKTIQKKLEDISKNLPAYQISGEGEGSTPISIMQQRLRRAFSHVEEEDVVSLESMTEDVLAQLMKQEDRLLVVSIVGMGGIGKTTLARKVYKHNVVKQHFDCFAWACISQKCIPREVVQDVLIKVSSPSKEERELIDKLTENELIIKLFHVLEEKRYLIVLDDIWKIQDWEILKKAFPRGKKGSKILFTTRIKGVALHADPCNSPIELPLLTNDESWSLFKRKAFSENTTESHARLIEFEMLGRRMVMECKGLPLAIVVLGGLLATKKSWAQWEMVERNIHAHLNEAEQQNQPYGAVNGILVLSYNDLPYNLKPCFLYLGHYPEDWEISKKELIRLWIAEGFISSLLESSGRLMEDVAENFLEELINRCLVQVGKRDHTGIGVKTCRVHDLLRDLCVAEAEKENFLEIIEPPIDDVVTLTASMRRRIAIHPSKRVLKVVKRFSDKWHVSSEIVFSFTNLRSLGIRFMRSKDVVHFLKALVQLHRLRSLNMSLLEDSVLSYSDSEPLSQCHHLSKLLIYGKIQEDPHLRHHVLKFVPANIAKLTLYGSQLKQDPMVVLEKLPHLRILQLSNYTYMGTKLICSANGFLQLDSLEIHYLLALKELEIEEGAMPHLRSLYLGVLSNLRMFPEGLRYLTALQEMTLSGMKRSLVERIEVIDGREGEDFSKVSHIPSIQIFGKED
ncbi:hypothetical protein CRYUN_Cryun41cG0013000 [Craigia yunnanensis]